MSKNLVPDLLPGLSHVGSGSHHDLVEDDSKGKEIGLARMVHSADDFRSHVARSPAGLFRVAFLLLASHSKICDSKISILFKDQVLRFEVSMNDAF